jgi:phosphoglucomutase
LNYNDEYNRWKLFPGMRPELREELDAMSENDRRESFSTELSFGTAGLRGIMGAGTGRMNIYTVSRATQGLADTINGFGREAAGRGAVVCYDCRLNSEFFAKSAAAILAANGVKTYLFDAMRPTPELSFAVLKYRCISGINITASHNPKEYNGYKVYWEDGAQIDDNMAALISKNISKVDIFAGVKTGDFDALAAAGKIVMLGEETDRVYIDAVMKNRIDQDAAAGSGLKIVYTPFHGTGYRFVPEVLRDMGITEVFCVKEQMIPDGTFPTVKSPNPEEIEGFGPAIELAKKVGSDLIIGTDPDADRVGLIVRNRKGEYVTITGNQTGILLADYIINAKRRTGTLPAKPAVVSTVVTSLMAERVCSGNGVYYGEAFTGFRFIAEVIRALEERGYTCLLGFEESYGYLIGSHCRDKDAVTASVMIAEMAAYYEKKGMTLYDALESLYEKYGYFGEYTLNIKMPGLDGIARMGEMMASLRANPPESIGGVRVEAVRDYKTGVRRTADGNETQLPLGPSNVLYFEMEDKNSFVIRPSGTEPKVKIYILARGGSREEIGAKLDLYKKAADELIKK